MRNPIKVLVADDHPVVRKGISLCLANRENVEIVGEAADGREAVRKAREIGPDIITLDVLMPLRSGWEALHELKTSPGTTEIPTIIISVIDEKQLAFTLGADEYLVKPVSREDLVAAVGRHLTKK